MHSFCHSLYQIKVCGSYSEISLLLVNCADKSVRGQSSSDRWKSLDFC